MYRGVWTVDTEYSFNDIATYNNSTYVFISPYTHSDETPPNLAYLHWSLFVGGGSTGPTGATGIAGPTGPTGAVSSIGFDGGAPSTVYSQGPVFDCGSVP